MTSTQTRPPASATEPAAAAPAARPVRVLGFRQNLSRWDLKFSPYLYISPFFIMFAIVGLFPIGYTAVISLMDWDLVRNSGEFIGFDQYVWILQNPQFWTALRNTFSIFLLSTVPQLILAIFIAAMLDRNIRAKTFWRMGVLLPYVMAPVAVALIFSNMFGDNHGLVNNILTDLGLQPIPWHKDPFWSHIAIATMVNFRWTGYNALILLAAMQAIPRDYYEAATVDGDRIACGEIGLHGMPVVHQGGRHRRIRESDRRQVDILRRGDIDRRLPLTIARCIPRRQRGPVPGPVGAVVPPLRRRVLRICA